MSYFSKNQSRREKGCMGLFIGVCLISLLAMIFEYVLAGALFLLMLALLCALIVVPIIVVWKLYFYETHKKPLMYDQIQTLARRNALDYINEMYDFDNCAIDPFAKFWLNASGGWYKVDEPVNTFPAYVATLLEGKQHEWVVIAIEKDGVIRDMLVNRGNDNGSVFFDCDINNIIQKCRQVGGYTVLRFHNHPYSVGYNTLQASEQDMASAKYYANTVCNAGFNWYDFVCSKGEFELFYSQISSTFEVNGKGSSDIIDKTGICPQMDYELQKEYRKKHKPHKRIKDKKVIYAVLILALVIFYIVGRGVLSDDNTTKQEVTTAASTSTASSSIEATQSSGEEAFYNLNEENIEEMLKEIPGILEVESATSETDENHLAGDKCSAVVYFTYDRVNQAQFQEDETTPAAKGTDAGGCIEVFYNLDDAKARTNKLKALQSLAGGSYRYGRIVIRTSSKLSSSEQDELEALIIEHITSQAES